MNKTDRNIYRCIRFVASLGDGGTYLYHPETLTAEAARRRGLLRAETALAHAPKTPVPAITMEFLALLHHRDFVWQPRGIYERRHVGDPRDMLHPGALASRLMTFVSSKQEKQIWWIGDGPSRVTIGEQTYAALVRAEALSDGRARIDGTVVELRPFGPPGGTVVELWDVQAKRVFVP